jgi:hypothetical protein
MYFIAMPFGTRPAKRGVKIDFDRVHQFIHRSASQAGLIGPTPKNNDEQGWHLATKLEPATADRD